MAIEHKLSASSRKDEGKGASRRLRHAGRIPAIIYGGGEEPQSVQLEHEETWLASKHDWFYASIITLDVDGKAQQVLLRDLQRHPYKQLLMHIDFQRVKAGEKLRTSVPLHFINIETSPAGKAADVSVTSEMNELDVSCLPKDLPEYIEVDLGNIGVGDTVHLSEVKLPEGVELLHKPTEDDDPAVAVARFIREEVEEAPEVEGEEGAEAEAPAEGEEAADGAAAAEGEGEGKKDE